MLSAVGWNENKVLNYHFNIEWFQYSGQCCGMAQCNYDSFVLRYVSQHCLGVCVRGSVPYKLKTEMGLGGILSNAHEGI